MLVQENGGEGLVIVKEEKSRADGRENMQDQHKQQVRIHMTRDHVVHAGVDNGTVARSGKTRGDSDSSVLQKIACIKGRAMANERGLNTYGTFEMQANMSTSAEWQPSYMFPLERV
ncbi:hypothetical protein VCV18_003989 [Metarhizium anisopliae]